MARRIKDADLGSKTAREKLRPSGKPYWRALDEGLHIGYRKGLHKAVWAMRRYNRDGTYQVKTIGIADDSVPADGVGVLTFFQAQEKARREAGTQGESSGPYKVADAVAAHLEHLEGRASYPDARYRLEAYVLPVFGSKNVAALTTDEIRRWHRKLAKSPIRLRTKPGAEQRYKATDLNNPVTRRQRQVSANRCLSQFKAALNRAYHDGKVPSAVAWQRVKPFRGVDEARTGYLTTADAQRLINTSEGDFRVLVMAALQTGCRYGELARSRVSDFNPDSGTLAIWQSKSGKPRHVVLTDEGQAFFAPLAAGRAGSDLLLGREWHKSQQGRPMREVCERAGIKPAIGFHQLRHTWASHAVMNGVPLLVVAKNLGHSDTRMVEKYYGHLAPSFVADAIRAGAPRFGGVEKSNVVPMS